MDIMDTGEGRMEMIHDDRFIDDMRKKYPKSKGIFTIGEIIEINGSRFKVYDISPFGIKLRVLKAHGEDE